MKIVYIIRKYLSIIFIQKINIFAKSFSFF